MKNNIVLIGMPGCGKSTVGIVLAKLLGYDFLDSDLLIQASEGRLLHQILEAEGPERFNRIEEAVNAAIRAEHTVIATGGSVVYGSKAMAHLKEIGTVVYLKLSLEEITNRLGDLAARGVSMRPGQTLADLYAERTPLYEQYADLTIACDGWDIRKTAEEIDKLLQRW